MPPPPPSTPSTPPLRLAVLLSGGGRTMVNLAARCADRSLNASIHLAIASADCPGVARAAELGIPCSIIPGVVPAAHLEATLRDAGIQAVALAGYLKYLNVPSSYEGRILNIHPSLLPKHGGKGMYGHHVHEAVLAARDRISGCTVHLVDAEFDHGSVILQRTCPVLPDDTPTTLAARVFEQECLAYPEAISLMAASWSLPNP